MEGLEALVGDLQADRPVPDGEFGDRLDRWAAAGFPRGRRPGLSDRATASDAGGRLRSFLESLTPRRLTYAGGAVATVVVLAVGVSQIDWTNDRDDSDDGGGGRAELSDDSGGGEDAARESVPQLEPLAEPDAGKAKPAVTDQALRDFGRRGTAELNSAAGPARGEEERKVERDVQMTLTAPADEVQDVTNDAIDIVRAHRGIVESSNSSITDDRAQATLQLVVPTRQLDSAIGQLSDLADVKSLGEGALDITRPFLDAKDRLADLRAEREGLRSQIETADTTEEIDELKRRLEVVNDEIARANADFENVKRRANLSNVTLQITSEGADEGAWSFDEALDDAGRVLEVGAGIALVAGAVLLPLALIGAIVYLIVGAQRRRARERALDE
jgi:hypothetical protein